MLKLNITCICFVYIVTDVDSNPPVKSPLKLVGSLLQPISHSVRSPGNFYHPASTPSQPYITADDHLVARSLARFSLASIYEHFKVLLAVLRAPSTSILFLLKLSIESVHAILLRLKIKGLHSQGISFQSPTKTLSVSLVTLTDTLHQTFRTASQMKLLLRTGAMLPGRRRTVCKQASFKRLTS